LLPEDKTAEGQVFYWKMAGDYWRYLAEFASSEDRKGKAEKAKEKYEQATKTAVEQGLPPTNPIRLGLALNFSVFFYEILNMPQVRVCVPCQCALTACDFLFVAHFAPGSCNVRDCSPHLARRRPAHLQRQPLTMQSLSSTACRRNNTRMRRLLCRCGISPTPTPLCGFCSAASLVPLLCSSCHFPRSSSETTSRCGPQTNPRRTAKTTAPTLRMWNSKTVFCLVACML
jgi:hypothetical protein